jgi:hypothetical protein
MLTCHPPAILSTSDFCSRRNGSSYTKLKTATWRRALFAGPHILLASYAFGMIVRCVDPSSSSLDNVQAAPNVRPLETPGQIDMQRVVFRCPVIVSSTDETETLVRSQIIRGHTWIGLNGSRKELVDVALALLVQTATVNITNFNRRVEADLPLIRSIPCPGFRILENGHEGKRESVARPSGIPRRVTKRPWPARITDLSDSWYARPNRGCQTLWICEYSFEPLNSRSNSPESATDTRPFASSGKPEPGMTTPLYRSP